MTLKRQFIAGASCPGCGEVDKIQRVSDGDRMWMECVRCGYRKDLDASPPDSAVDALATPVTLKPAGRNSNDD